MYGHTDSPYPSTALQFSRCFPGAGRTRPAQSPPRPAVHTHGTHTGHAAPAPPDQWQPPTRRPGPRGLAAANRRAPCKTPRRETLLIGSVARAEPGAGSRRRSHRDGPRQLRRRLTRCPACTDLCHGSC